MIYIIAGGRSSGKTETALDYYSKVSDPFGFVTFKKTEKNLITGYDLLDPGTSERIPFIADKEKCGIIFSDYEENPRFIFRRKTYKYVFESFKRESGKGHSFFLDEIGNMELVLRRGFYDSLLLLLDKAENNDVYLTVSDRNLGSLINLIRGRKTEYRIIRKIHIAAVILASGSSARFGNKNKLLEKINGKSLYRITVENMIKADVFSSIIVVSGDREILSGSSQYWNIETVCNDRGDSGISESVKKGVEAADKYSADGYMFIPCDQVMLSVETVRKLAAVFIKNSCSIVVPVYNSEWVSPAVFSSAYGRELLMLEGDTGGRKVAEDNISSVVEVEMEEECDFIDIDTIDDYYIVKEKYEGDGSKS